MAENLVEAFNEPFAIGKYSISITVSVGVAIFPDHGHTSQELISRADEAMYSIKRTGKGAWRMWSAF